MTPGHRGRARDRRQPTTEPSQAPGVSDVAVVGAGIIGLATARELLVRHPGLRVVVLEREPEVGVHQTGHNSGVIHSGVYYEPGSLKARLCVSGAARMYDYCVERAIPHERCGKLIVAIRDDELARLDDLERRGRENGVPGLRRVSAAEIGEIEPEARGLAALHCPSTGIVDYRLVARALAADIVERGGSVLTSSPVHSVSWDGRRSRLRVGQRELVASMTLSCAGLWSDRLAVASGADADPRIVPFRGGYLHVRSADPPLLRGMVYPVPDPALPFLGVHVTKHIDGQVSLGPTALMVGSRTAYRLRSVSWRDVRDTASWPGTWRMARKFWRTGLTELAMATSRRRFVEAAAAYVPRVAELGVHGPGTGGIRAQALARDGRLVDDFVISEVPGALHVRNAPSPAATSSLALAAELVDRAERSEAWQAVSG